MSSKRRMRRIPAGIRHIAIVLAVLFGIQSLVPSAYGYPILSEPVSMEDARAADLATIQQMLETKVVQHRLEELGFTQDEIALRLEMASNADLHRLATQSEDLMAGGAVGLVVAVLVVILLVVVILRIVSNDTLNDSDMLLA
jgi:hypothetical protein